MSRVEAGQVEELVHVPDGGECQPLVEAVVHLGDPGVFLRLGGFGVEHQVFGHHLEVEVAEEREDRHGGGEPVDEFRVWCRVPRGVGKEGVEEGRRCTDPAQRRSAELGVLGLGEEVAVGEVGAQVDSAQPEIVDALGRHGSVRGDLEDQGAGVLLGLKQVAAQVVGT
ncbi:hypothetical protein [Kitasatospora purpeofusca]|uniref:hypothetical protein n=1 Tax=Kitasatospora purpeofusca TaxID=67352 RepID=UPI003654B079